MNLGSQLSELQFQSAKCKVPLIVESNESIKVDPKDWEYPGKAKIIQIHQESNDNTQNTQIQFEKYTNTLWQCGQIQFVFVGKMIFFNFLPEGGFI